MATGAGAGKGLAVMGLESPSQKNPTMAMMAAATTKPMRSSGLKRRLLDMMAVTVTESELLASICMTRQEIAMIVW